MSDELPLGTFRVNGKPVTLEEFRKNSRGLEDGTPMAPATSGWPVYSDGAGVHPDQIQDARSAAEQRGVPTDFLPDGRAIFRDRAHRGRYLKAFGLYDRNGAYGDG